MADSQMLLPPPVNMDCGGHQLRLKDAFGRAFGNVIEDEPQPVNSQKAGPAMFGRCVSRSELYRQRNNRWKLERRYEAK